MGHSTKETGADLVKVRRRRAAGRAGAAAAQRTIEEGGETPTIAMREGKWRKKNRGCRYIGMA